MWAGSRHAGRRSSALRNVRWRLRLFDKLTGNSNTRGYPHWHKGWETSPLWRGFTTPPPSSLSLLLTSFHTKKTQPSHFGRTDGRPSGVKHLKCSTRLSQSVVLFCVNACEAETIPSLFLYIMRITVDERLYGFAPKHKALVGTHQASGEAGRKLHSHQSHPRFPFGSSAEELLYTSRLVLQ